LDNIIFLHCVKLKYQIISELSLNKNLMLLFVLMFFFDNVSLQIWPGYTTAVHEFEDGLYLVMLVYILERG
jgi:hypothetical protein